MVRLLAVLVVMGLSGTSRAGETARIPLSNQADDLFELSQEAREHVFELPVSQAENLVIDVRTPTVMVDVTIVDPTGAALAPALLKRFNLSPGEAPVLSAGLFEEGQHVQASVANPPAGRWKVRVSLPAGAEPTFGTITASMTGGLGIAAMTSRPGYTVGKPVILSLLAFDKAIPVSGATVTGTVYQLGAEVSPLSSVSLRDDGVSPDASAGDGMYTVRIEDLPVGHYLAEVVLSRGESQATSATSFEVHPSLARFNGLVSNSGDDTNADGLFEFIRVNLGVQVDKAGSYEVLADLQHPSGAVLHGVGHASLTEGSQALTVSFAAADIRKYLARDGAWRIRDVRLVDVESSRMVDQRDDFGMTNAYPLSSLQRPVTLISAGLRESAVDTNGNGYFDALVVHVQVDTLRAGSYTWTGELQAFNGKSLGVASGQGTLVAGIQSISLSFEGSYIGRSGLDGPYRVGNVLLYGPADAAAVMEKVGSTRAYRAVLFEGSQISIGRMNEEIRRLAITSRGGLRDGEELRASLLRKLESVKQASAQGRVDALGASLSALMLELRAAEGVHLDAAEVQRLIRMAQLLATSSDRRD